MSSPFMCYIRFSIDFDGPYLYCSICSGYSQSFVPLEWALNLNIVWLYFGMLWCGSSLKHVTMLSNKVVSVQQWVSPCTFYEWMTKFSILGLGLGGVYFLVLTPLIISPFVECYEHLFSNTFSNRHFFIE